jgi:type II secretory pathway pseudopilin PulG
MNRRGGLLLETMLSLAIFVAAASMVLSIFSDGTRSLRRAASLGNAADAARSLIAELEAGIRSPGDLRDAIDDLPPPWSAFRLEVAVERSDFPGLVEVEVRVFDGDGPSEAPRFTLRQLVPAGSRGDGDGEAESLDESEAFGEFDAFDGPFGDELDGEAAGPPRRSPRESTRESTP